MNICVPNSHPGLATDSDLCHGGLCVHFPVVNSCCLPSKQHPTRWLQGHQPCYRSDIQTNQQQSAHLNMCTYLVVVCPYQFTGQIVKKWNDRLVNLVSLLSCRSFVWPQHPESGGRLHCVRPQGAQEDVPHEHLWKRDQRWMWSWYRYVRPFQWPGLRWFRW